MDKINRTIRQRNRIKRGIFELLMSPGPVSHILVLEYYMLIEMQKP